MDEEDGDEGEDLIEEQEIPEQEQTVIEDQSFYPVDAEELQSKELEPILPNVYENSPLNSPK